MPADDETAILTEVLEFIRARATKESCAVPTSHRPSAKTFPIFDHTMKQLSPFVNPGRFTVTTSPESRSVKVVKSTLMLTAVPAIAG